MAKIMIIDDEPDVNAAMQVALTGAGHSVVVYENHDNAEQNVEKEMPDLLFLDIMFPGNPVAGFETCRSLKENKKTKPIPIVVISAINEEYGLGYTGKGSGPDALPAAAFIEKPVEPQEALDLVEELLETE